jgi:hypothetical protein
MAYTTTELITRAWYLSGIVSRDLETVSGDQLNDGLQMLNSVLAMKTANQRLIPYYKKYNLNGVVGQEKYFIPKLIEIETFTFFIQSVRYSTIGRGRKEYFGSPRVDGINSLPFNWHVERTLDGSDLYIYFTPDQTYPMEIWGKFSLTGVVLGEDLSLTLDQFYIEYLRYALAEYMCQEYNVNLQPSVVKKLTEFESIIVDISPLDLRMQKNSTLNGYQTINYAQVNIGKGYTPL